MKAMKFNKLISISLLVALSVTGAMAQDHYLTWRRTTTSPP